MEKVNLFFTLKLPKKGRFFMIRSMTGFGRGENIEDGRKFTVEIKSVNHRYNDLTIKLPRNMNYIEDFVRKKLNKVIFRGKTDVFISFESTSKEDIKVVLNEEIADAYVEQFNLIKQRYNTTDEITLSLISQIPDVITVEKVEADDDMMLHILEPALNSAIDGFLQMREREGIALKKDILLKLDKIEALVENIKIRAPQILEDYKSKLKSKLEEILESKDIDESRIITEVTIFADKCATDEEVTRLESHINQIKIILEENEPIGRKLDFIIQEMNREANTIGSKSNDIETTKYMVELKSEIEKIREQIQNVE